MQRPRSAIPRVDGVGSLGFQTVEHTLLKFVLTKKDFLRIDFERGFLRLFFFFENRPGTLESGGGNLRSDRGCEIPIELFLSGHGFGSPRSVGGIAEDRQSERRG